MRSIETALAVDFARRGAIGIAIALLTMIGLPLWLMLALGYAHAGIVMPTNSREAVGLHVNLALLMGFGAAVSIVHALGQLRRFFIRPVSAARLVTCQMGLGMATIAAMYTIAAGIVNLTGVDWPVLGPALFLATTLACTLTVMWAFEGSDVAKVIGCVFTIIPLMIWFNRCYGATTFGDWQTMWSHPTPMEMLSLAGVSLLSYMLAIKSVSRVRHGELWTFASWQAWWEQQRSRVRSNITFRNSTAALRWSLWRERMGLLPASLVGCWLLFLITLRITNVSDTAAMLKGAVSVSWAMLLLIMPILFALLQGSSCHGRNWHDMRHMLATRPVTDQTLAWEILRSCALSTLLAWLTWTVGMVVLSLLALLLGDGEVLLQVPAPLKLERPADIMALVAVPLVSWIASAHMTTLVATGRAWLWPTVLFAVVGGPIVMSATQSMFNPAAFAWIVNTSLVVSLLLCLAGAAWAFGTALRKRLITLRQLLVVGGLGLLASVAIWMLVRPAHFLPIVEVWHSVGLCALALAPLATMPLAIHWNRHR